MDNKKDIGKLFKARLEETEVMPKESVWSAIAETLNQKKKRRGFFLFFGGLIAVLVFISASYVLFSYSLSTKEIEPIETPIIQEQSNNQDNISSENAATSEKEIKKNSNTSASESSTNTSNVQNSIEADITNGTSKIVTNNIKTSPANNTRNNVVNSNASRQQSKSKKQIINPSNDNTLSSTKDKLNTIKKTSEAVDEASFSNPNTTKETSKEKQLSYKNDDSDKKRQSNETENNDVISSNETTIITDSLNAKENLIKKLIKKKEEKKEKEELKPVIDFSQLLISAYVGPSYYNFISKGTPFDETLLSGKTSGVISMSYAVFANMPISNKTTFRLGYRKSSIAFKVQEASNNINTSGLRSIFNNTAISRNRRSIPSAISTFVNGGGVFELEQKINYWEVPFEVYHTIKEGKIRIDAIGGISLIFLGKDSVTINTIEGDRNIGGNNYLKRASLSLNTGLGFRHQLNDRLRLDIEPMFLYQPSAFDNDFQNLNPIRFIIQTGITYKY